MAYSAAVEKYRRDLYQAVLLEYIKKQQAVNANVHATALATVNAAAQEFAAGIDTESRRPNQ
jgi:hypothetical protein